jgi:hypothetical protein
VKVRIGDGRIVECAGGITRLPPWQEPVEEGAAFWPGWDVPKRTRAENDVEAEEPSGAVALP